MKEFLIQLVTAWPPELATLFLAMVPVTELRAAIPVATAVWHLTPWAAFGWAVVGNVIPVFFILWWLEPITRWLGTRSQFARRGLEWLFDRTRRKFNHDYETYGLIGLAIFVAIPLPGTGAWTGALAAWLFGIPFKKAVPAIIAGVIGAGIVVTLITAGALAGWEWLVS